MRTALILASLVALTACGRDRGDVRPDLPDTVIEPQIQIVERIVYVPIPAALLKPEAIAEGPIAQCFSVAAQRRAAVERCNAKLENVGAIQGTEVKP